MFQSISHRISAALSRRRNGIDKTNVEHLRADLRFRLAMVEYVYFGRSGRRVARCLAEMKSLLGDRAMHRYLRSLDEDLRTQFVERFHGVQRESAVPQELAGPLAGDRSDPDSEDTRMVMAQFQDAKALAPNVVPIGHASAARRGSRERGADETEPSTSRMTTRADQDE